MWRGIYAITDSTLLPNDADLLEKCEQALKAGIALLQYRDKSQDTTKRIRQARALLNLCRSFNTPLIVNDDVELAQRVNADGVHLGQTDLDYKSARSQLGHQKIIGITCHASLDLAQKAQYQGADYVAFGACFPSPTKPLAPTLELSILGKAKQTLTIPIVAIGGINQDNIHEIANTGVDLFAVISAAFATNTVYQNILLLNDLIEQEKS